MSQDELIVRIAEGAVRGRKDTSARGGVEFLAFQGIPYAQPPVGPLRYKAPQPAQPWQGVRDATKEGSPSMSFDIMTRQAAANSSEDCLFINVFTTEVGRKNLRPVLFWVHGGGFVFGSSSASQYGPGYLVTEGVVLVTFNYRLGVLGFLSLENGECPGNYGLKDMVEALRWVQRNIAAFGGDPDNVTIFGESAGGAAVHYLLLSKTTKGLFHKAIAQSGAAFNPWAISKSPRARAFALGEVLGCKTTDEKELLEFFREVPADKTIGIDERVVQMTDPLENYFQFAFVPCVEPESEDAFLSRTPEEIMRSGDYTDVPLIQGVNSLECVVLLMFKPQITTLSSDEDLKTLIPADWKLDRDSDICKTIVNKIRKFYLNRDDKFQGIVDALSQVYFVDGVIKSAEYVRRHPARKSPSYFYLFDFDGEMNVLKKLLGVQMKGSSHADDLAYLFSGQPPFGTSLSAPGTRERAMVESLTRMWTDFAKTGNPTPEDRSWLPQTAHDKPYLHITDDTTMRRDLEQGQLDLWSELEELVKKK